MQNLPCGEASCDIEQALRQCWKSTPLNLIIPATDLAETNRFDVFGQLKGDDLQNYATLRDLGEIDSNRFSSIYKRTHQFRLTLYLACKPIRSELEKSLDKWSCCRRVIDGGKVDLVEYARPILNYDSINMQWTATSTVTVIYSKFRS